MKIVDILTIIHICFGFTGLNGYVKPKIKTKQIATIGPVCSDYKSLSNLHSNGVNIFRINLSHESQISLVEKVDILNYIRSISPYKLEILLDLQGPKHRIGKVRKNTIIKKGNYLLLDKNNIEGDEHRVYLGHDNIYKNIEVGNKILINDGLVELNVTESGKDYIMSEVIKGGELKSNKGVNLPNCKLDNICLTNKDLNDIRLLNTLKIDYVALSFVESKNDIINLKNVLDKKIKIIGKIERPLALENIDEICDECDGIMIARGDLGVEIGIEKVPMIQKKCIKVGREKNKEVIVATQMMESMITNPIPTRAEVSDIANAVLDGATGLMLSGETSVGNYGVDCVKIQRKVIEEIENNNNYFNLEKE